MSQTNLPAKRVVKWTYLTFGLLMLAWIAAWMCKIQLDRVNEWAATSAGSFVYWTTAKLLIWILPAWWLIKFSGRSIKQVFNFANYKGWLLWGGGIGLAIALTGFIPNYLNGAPLFPTQLSFALVNVLIIAPIFEEFLMRGAVLGNLQQGYSFLAANIITSLMFILLHLPGWFFMGSLLENLEKPVGGALSIFIVSLLFGYAVKRSNSLMGGILAHFLNNLA